MMIFLQFIQSKLYSEEKQNLFCNIMMKIKEGDL